jgi:hypothetical protein
MAETMLWFNEHGAANLTGMTETLPLATSASPLLKTRAGRTVSVAFDPAARGPFAQWQRAINRPDLATDPRFADDDARRANRAQLVELIQSWVMEFPDVTSLEAALAKAKTRDGRRALRHRSRANAVGQGTRRRRRSERPRQRRVETAEFAVAFFESRQRRAGLSRRTQSRNSARLAADGRRTLRRAGSDAGVVVTDAGIGLTVVLGFPYR